MPSASLPIIGLAGGIGAGKSAVAEILRDLGCLVCDSDALGRQALEDEAIKTQLVEWWGGMILDEEGRIDRQKVAAIVFGDQRERKRLEGVSHPWIEKRRQEQFAAAGEDVKALVIDAPLLFEAGLDAECDAVIFVDVSRTVRLARVRAKRGWTEEMLLKREDSQLPLDQKQNRADYVISNDGEMSDLTQQVKRILDEITSPAD